MAKSKGILLKSTHSLKERLISGTLALATTLSLAAPIFTDATTLTPPNPGYDSGYPDEITLRSFSWSGNFYPELVGARCWLYNAYFDCANGGVYAGFCLDANRTLSSSGGTYIYDQTYNQADYRVLTGFLDYYFAAEYSNAEIINATWGLSESEINALYGWGTPLGDARMDEGKFFYLTTSGMQSLRAQTQLGVWWARTLMDAGSTDADLLNMLGKADGYQSADSPYDWYDLQSGDEDLWWPTPATEAVILKFVADRLTAEGLINSGFSYDSDYEHAVYKSIKRMILRGVILKDMSYSPDQNVTAPYAYLNLDYHVYNSQTNPSTTQRQVIAYPKESTSEPGDWYGAIAVNKVNNTGDGIYGTQFSVFKDQACTTPAFSDFSFVTDSNGYGMLSFKYDWWEDYDPANPVYYVKEVMSSAGHERDMTPYPVTVQLYEDQATANSNPTFAVGVNGTSISNTVIDYPDSGLTKIDSKTLGGVGPATFNFTGYPYSDIYLPSDAPTASQDITNGLYDHKSDMLEDGKISIDFDLNSSGEGIIQWHSPSEAGYIPPGKYTVTETQAPPGYALSTESQEVDLYGALAVGPNGSTYVEFYGPENIEIANDPLHRIKIKKIDETGTSLAGAVFSLSLNGSEIDRQTTESDGIIIFDGDGEGLNTGLYTVREEKAPDGYSMSSYQYQDVWVDVTNHDQTVYEYTFTNYSKTPIRIFKTDEAGAGIGGATFHVTLDNHDLGTHVSAANGEIMFLASDYAESVMSGDGPWLLTVTEVSPPPGYTLDPDVNNRVQEVYISKGQDLVQVTFKNNPIPELEIYKRSGKGEPLGDAVYDVTIGEHTISGVTTEGDGLFKIDYEEFGTYLDPELDSWTVTVTEVSAPPGYLLPDIDDRTQVKVLKAGQSKLTFYFVNEKYPEIEIYKTDDEGNPLGGGVYDVTIGNHSISGVVTGDDGKFLICWDTHGAFLDATQEYWTVTVTEVSPPPGYTLPPVDERTQTKVLYSGQDLLQIHFRNQKIPEIEIYKTDNEGNPLAGAVYDVTIGTHTIANVVTDEDGKFLICWETHGDFLDISQEYWTVTVTEVTAPPGYLLPAVEDRTQTKVLYAGQDIMTFHFRIKRFLISKF